MIFNNTFEELNYDNIESQQTEVDNNDADNTVNVKQLSKASRNLLNLFPIKILLKQCKGCSSRHRETIRLYCATWLVGEMGAASSKNNRSHEIL